MKFSRDSWKPRSRTLNGDFTLLVYQFVAAEALEIPVRDGFISTDTNQWKLPKERLFARVNLRIDPGYVVLVNDRIGFLPNTIVKRRLNGQVLAPGEFFECEVIELMFRGGPTAVVGPIGPVQPGEKWLSTDDLGPVTDFVRSGVLVQPPKERSGSCAESGKRVPREDPLRVKEFTLPKLGVFTYDAPNDEYRSGPLPMGLFDSKPMTIVLDNYADDDNRAEFQTTLQNIFSRNRQTLYDISDELHRYWHDCIAAQRTGKSFTIERRDDLWNHVYPYGTAYVSRRFRGDEKVYVQIRCHSDWDVDSDFQLVLREGLHVTRLGPCDGSLTNSDAAKDPSLESVIYDGLKSLPSQPSFLE
jgi:hypothetical protein